MFNHFRKSKALKRFRKTMTYSRIRQYFPMPEAHYIDDRNSIEDAEIVRIDWPEDIIKPRVGVIRDFQLFPYWPKYCRFLENNSFPYAFYDIHSCNWVEQAGGFDVIVGLISNTLYHLEEIREKYYFLEKYLGKQCFPTSDDALLYENKKLETYVSQAFKIPYARTYISHCKEDALALVKNLKFPCISKINPASGSVGVELVQTPKHAFRIIEQAFSRNGRKVHVHYFRQKNYIYFQEYIPNDGYDIRAIVTGGRVFGYYRKVLEGDFRASGMNLVEKRGLPEGAVRIAWEINQIVKSPLLVIDMLHGLDGKYYVIEFSPICQMSSPEQLHVNGKPGMYVFDNDGNYHFEHGRYWVAELALREYFLKDYLPKYQ